MKRFRKSPVVLAAIGLVSIAVVILCRMLSSPSMTPYVALQSPPSGSGPSRVSFQFLGTSTILFDDGKTRLMSDGFFSRPSIWRLLTGKIPPDDRSIDSALSKAGITRLDAILVAHSHHDHAMDTARVAQRTGAMVYGSASTRNVVLGDGLPPQRFTSFEDGKTYPVGDFAVTVFRTPHSPDVAYPGTIDHPLRTPASASDYREGGNYSFLIRRGATRILLVASGNFIPGKFKDVRADTVFLGIGGLGKQSEKFMSDYWREVVRTVGAKVVIPVHWDDFTRPLNEPMRPMPYALDDFDRSMGELLSLARRDGVRIRLPVPFGTVEVD